ncbi:MAG: hypothetical protein HN348_04950 [Proteobacteria bacterium]|nr:hypothetical protein [Pseudomonadota bacterium]
MEIRHSYSKASGWGFQDAFGIALRFPSEEGFTPQAGESWIVKTSPGNNTTVLDTYVQKPGWYTDVWRSTENRVYVTDIEGSVLHGPLPPGDVWPQKQVGFTLAGIWGLDDRHVYVWGLRGKDPAMATWDGAQWREVPSPDFQVNGLHGTAPDLLVAVGSLGEISCRDVA